MPGIFRHLIIACALSIGIFILFYDRINIFSIVFFILGNVLPDMVFIPGLVIKYKTLDAEKIVKTRVWKVLSNWDEIVMFIITTCFLFVFPSLEISMLMIGVVIHMFIDKFMFEENLWW